MPASALRNSLRAVPKSAYPFRLGTSSYIIPADILPNVRSLAPLVDDIELVLFESPDVSNIPTAADIRELAAIASDHGLSFTVHLPTDRHAGAASTEERVLFLDGCRRIIERCSPLSPFAWVLHLEGVRTGASSERVAVWQECCDTSLGEIVRCVSSPASVAVENLDYPWQWHRGLVSRHKASLCCDIGHLWVYSPDSWVDQARAMLPDTRVVHLHGVQGTADHLSLARGESTHQQEFLRMLAALPYQGVTTLEIFSEQDFTESVERVAELWEVSR
jgi:sugar phosphate isomerase/epimerase